MTIGTWLRTVGLVGLVACGADQGNTLVSWVRQGDSASFRLPAHAVWCRDQGWLELVAARNDTGIGVAVFPTDSIFTGRYAVLPVLERRDSVRPAAGLAVRWFSTTELLTFEGHDGEIVIDGDEAMVHGRFSGRLRVLVGEESLELEGEFRDVPVTWGGIECQLDSDSGAADPRDVVD